MIFRRRVVSKSVLRREIAKLILDLKQLHKRVFFYRSRLESKIMNYEERLKYVSSEDIANAIRRNIEMYSNALKVIMRIEAVLELMIVKLDTLGMLNITFKEIALMKKVLENVREMSKGIPDISLIVEDMSERAGDLLDYMPETPSSSLNIYVSSEASKILEDASKVAESRLRESASTGL